MCRKLTWLISFVLALGLAARGDSAEPFREIGGLVVMEGEKFIGSAGRTDENNYQWRVSTGISGFVGSGYVDTPGPQGTNGTWANACELTYEIRFSTAGTYNIWLRRYTVGGASNSCSVGLDGQQMGTNDNTGDENQWIWKNLGTMTVTAGPHVFNLRRREAEYKVDRILLTTDSAYTPSGNGPPESFQGVQFKPYAPDPADGAADVTVPLLQWKAGETATWHDVYVGTNPTLGPADFVRRVQITSHWHDPPGFVPGTTYYWRIDEVEIDGTTIHTGDVWSFKYATLTAYSPSPPDGAKYVSIDVDLSWAAGISGITHDVYFGTNQTDVTNGTSGTSKGNQLGKTYEPGTLNKDTVYYWRIDEVEFDKTTKYEGTVWSFKTAPDITIADPNLLCWWKFDEGAGTTAVDWSGHDHHGTLEGDPQWVDGFAGGALQFGGDGNRVVDNAAAAYLNGLSAVTVCMWIKSDVTGIDRGFINAEEPDSGDNVITMRYDAAGSTAGGTNVLKMAVTSTAGEQQLESSDDAQTTEWQHVAMVWSSGQELKFYINAVLDTPTANDAAAVGTTSGCTKLIVGQGGKDAGSGWDGLIDDVRIYNKVLTPEQIKQAMRGDPTLAWNPKPANKSLTDVARAAPLTWSPGEKAAQHDVYLGTDQTAVANATAASTGIYRGRQVAASYAPPEGLQWGGGPYYWRIDEYNTDGTLSAGRVWSFTVADYLIVDDFEDYNDDVGSRIFQTWRDGLGFSQPAPGYPGNGTGSGVGNSVPPYAEQTIVHSGKQSMPASYDNTGAGGKTRYSETQREWATAQDWTRYNVKALTLYFYGDPNNTAEQLYVALEDNAGHIKVVNHPDPEAVQIGAWQEWPIELTQFSGAGVNLMAIKKMYIGLGNRVSPKAGGTGSLYLDDIRLYKARCVASLLKPDADLNSDCVVDYADLQIMAADWLKADYTVATAAPKDANLVLYYKFENNAVDSSGKGINGTATGSPSYASGVFGQAISLNGSNYINCGNPALLNFGLGNWSIAAWVKTAQTDKGTVFANGGDETGGIRYALCIGEAGAGQVTVTTDNDVTKVQAAGATTVNDNQWHHVVGLRKGAELQVYVDGVLDGSNTLPAGYDLSGTSQHNAYVGVITDHRDATGNTLEKFYSGLIDELRIYNYALSDPEAGYLATKGAGGLYFPLDSAANLYDQEPQNQKKVNFKDLAILAGQWLEQSLWP